MRKYKTSNDNINEVNEYNNVNTLKSPRFSSDVSMTENLFNEYKKNFQNKNFTSISNILAGIESIDNNSAYIDIINGEQYLYHGNCDKSFFHLNKYLSENNEVDPYALQVIANWNEMAGFYRIAYSQYAKSASYPMSHKSLAWVLFSAITNKKRSGFLNGALSYYERLISVTEGYKLLRLIRIEMVHLYVVKKNFQAAISMITQYNKIRQCIFIKRLKVYIDYVEHNYNEILKYKDERPLDLYISYIIGRIGLENPDFEWDIRYYFEKVIKQGENSAYVYNSYGNYYMKMNKLTEAYEQYQNALTVDSTFESAIENINFLKKYFTPQGELIYNPDLENESVSFPIVESDPDVEEMGFLNINSLLGYTNFKKSQENIKKMGSLRLISQLFQNN